MIYPKKTKDEKLARILNKPRYPKKDSLILGTNQE